MVSVTRGTKHNRMQRPEVFPITDGSKPSPPSIRMVVKATFLKSDDNSGLKQRDVVFRTMIPEMIIPKTLGRRRAFDISPPTYDERKIKMKGKREVVEFPVWTGQFVLDE